ncbi:Uncharacterised protein [Escherichia coli]|nr:Uncharacterised protein [Escherichia coli]VVZ93428.1 Uncharacterised protein [Escherichia coli]
MFRILHSLLYSMRHLLRVHLTQLFQPALH